MTSSKRRGRLLPGRYVRAHLRRHPKDHDEFVSVAAYQERIDPTPSDYEGAKRQQEFNFEIAARHEGDLCECGNFAMVRSGTVLKCMTCGKTTKPS